MYLRTALRITSILLVSALILFSACHKKNSAAVDSSSNMEDVDRMDQKLMEDGPLEPSKSNSVIIGKVVEIKPNSANDSKIPTCTESPCRAIVEIMAMTRRGSSFHGQFNESDQVEMQFYYSLNPTSEGLPEGSTPLSGLSEGDFFEAEIFEIEAGNYRIQYYEKKQ